MFKFKKEDLEIVLLECIYFNDAFEDMIRKFATYSLRDIVTEVLFEGMSKSGWVSAWQAVYPLLKEGNQEVWNQGVWDKINESN